MHRINARVCKRTHPKSYALVCGCSKCHAAILFGIGANYTCTSLSIGTRAHVPPFGGMQHATMTAPLGHIAQSVEVYQHMPQIAGKILTRRPAHLRWAPPT